MLNDAGFPETTIVLSSDLDELVILQILTQIGHEAQRYGLDPDHLVQRLAFGVGTRLITSWGEPALGGVYKLVAAFDDGRWVPVVKVSDSSSKTPNPGHKQVWRVYDGRAKATSDLMSLDGEDPREMDRVILRHPTNHTKRRTLEQADISEIEPLLTDVMREGSLLHDLPSIEVLRERRRSDVRRLDPGVRRLMNPHIYHVSLTQKLWELKHELINSAMDKSH
jgi:nicotinate phosphoribosyltransferase